MSHSQDRLLPLFNLHATFSVLFLYLLPQLWLDASNAEMAKTAHLKAFQQAPTRLNFLPSPCKQ